MPVRKVTDPSVLQQLGSASPAIQNPMFPSQMQGQQLQNVHTQQQIASQPLQNENTRANIAQSRNTIANSRFDNIAKLRSEFNALPDVKNFSDATTALGGMFRAPDSAQGDLSVIYGYAKAMDPGSVVREGEMDMANSTASQVAQVNQMLKSVTAGKRLPPDVRVGLIEAARQKLGGMRPIYDQQYQRYSGMAKQNGFDPAQVVGPPIYSSINGLEHQFIDAHQPKAPQPLGPGDIGFNQRKEAEPFNPQQQAAFDAWVRANPNATPDQLVAFTKSIGLPGFSNPEEYLKAVKAGNAGPASTARFGKPDISDVRGGKNTSLQDTINSIARGVPDVLTMGSLDKLVALGDTVTKGGTFDQNLNRQYSISDYDTANHPFARLGGQLLGGALLPLGELKAPGQIVGKGAGVGGAYGLGSSRTLDEVPQNTLLGAASGAILPEFLGSGFAGRGLAARNAIATTAPDGLSAASQGLLMRQKQLDAAAAGDRLGIQMPRFVAGGPTAQRLGALADQSQIGAPFIRRATNAMLDQSEAARNTIANQTGGRILDQESMGNSAIAGAKSARSTLKGDYGRMYDVAERLSGDTRVPLPTAKQEVLSQIAELNDTPGGQQPAIAGTLQDIAAKMDGDWTPAGIRRMRTQLRQRFVDSGFDQGDASRRAQRITDAAEQDMVSGLRASNKGDAASAWQKASQQRASYQRSVDEVFNPILGINKEKTGPEVARGLVSAVKNNPARFRQFMAHLPPENANDIRASLIGQMGNPGSGGQDVAGEAFSLGKFLTHWNDIKSVRNQVFDPVTVNSLNDLARVAERAKQAGHVENHSQTGSIGIAMLTAGPATSAPGLLMAGQPKAAAAAVATSVVLGAIQAAGAKVLASPKLARTLADLAKAEAAGNATAFQNHLGNLGKIGATNPELRQSVQTLLTSLANDNSRMGSAVASPQQGPDQQKRP